LHEGTFVLLPEEKVFADLSDSDRETTTEEDSESLPDRLLHTDPLASTYQRLGTETIDGRNTQKYRVTVNSSTGGSVSSSETVIWIDDALQMPIKSETKSANGAHSTVALSEIALDIDPSLFRVPEGYEKITFTELRKRLKLN
jgi:outer membrane lipoprotein-sorting protein